MKAIVSIYKSDAVEYCKEKKIKKEDVDILISQEQFDNIEQKYDEVIFLSFPIGVVSDTKYWKEKMLKPKKGKTNPPKKEAKDIKPKEEPKEEPKKEKKDDK